MHILVAFTSDSKLWLVFAQFGEIIIRRPQSQEEKRNLFVKWMMEFIFEMKLNEK